MGIALFVPYAFFVLDPVVNYFPVVGQAQQSDTLVVRDQIDKVESLRDVFYKQADSIKQQYKNKLVTLQDTLNKSTQVSNVADSVIVKQQELLAALNGNIDSLKAQTTRKLQHMRLPPEVEKMSSQFTNEVESFKLPDADLPLTGSIDTALPDLDLTKLSSEIPALNTSLPALPKELDLNDYTKNIEQLNIGNSSVNQNFSEVLESKALETTGLATISEQTLPLPSAQDSEQLKKEVIDLVQQEAIDHFAGKEKELNEAMAQMGKLKRKYSSLNSLSEIPKRRPNEMRGKPIIERLLPQVVFQVYNRNNDILIDWANYIGWRFSGRFTAGPGWNQRIGYSTKNYSIHNQNRVYGPRVFGEYKWVKGFKPRVEIEYMRTFLPPHAKGSKQDPIIQEWVPAVFVGLNKELSFLVE